MLRLCALALLCNLELCTCKGTKSYFCSAKNNQQLWNISWFKHQNRQKQNGNAPITIHELDLLNFICLPVYHCTRVKLRFLRVYIETLAMSSREPPKKKSQQVENKQGTLLSRAKPCTSGPEPGVVEETIRIKEQPEMKMIWSHQQLADRKRQRDNSALQIKYL